MICYEGKVLAKSRGVSKTITKGKALRTYKNNFEYWELNENAPSWLQGESLFKNAPLDQVILALEDQYNIDIIDSKIDTTIRFTGFFHTQESRNGLKNSI